MDFWILRRVFGSEMKKKKKRPVTDRKRVGLCNAKGHLEEYL
jgi:hypothetical protein